MSSIPLPALGIKPPQQPDPIESYGNLLRLKMLAGQGQLQQGQQQLQQAQIQEAQQNLAARKALNDAFASSVTKDDKGNTSFDPDKLQSALASGPAAYKTPEVLEGITKFQKGRVDLQTSITDLQQKSADMIGGAAAAVKAAGYDPTLAHSLLDQLPHNPQIDQLRAKIDADPQGFRAMIDSAIAASPKQQTFQNARDVANIRANNVEKMEMQDWLQKNPGKTPADYQQFKVDQGVQATVAKETNPDVLKARKDLAVTTAQAEIPGKVEAARQEATVKQQIEGQTKLGYAFDPATNRTIPISQTDYLANKDKYQAWRPVTEKEYSDDRQLNNRLADVAQKIARYEETLQNDLSPSDKAIFSNIVDPSNKFKVALFHSEVPLDSVNQFMKSVSMNALSPAGQKRLIAFRNAEEAMVGYQRVLSGSGRSSDKAMELNQATLPHPMVDKGYGNEAMSQFKENIKIASQGLPTLPGLKSPDEVVSSMAHSEIGPKTGDTKTYQGSTYKFDGKQWVRQ